jgi:hypothetical protein
MDPVSLVVGALAAGAGAGLKDTAAAGVKDAYAGLKQLLVRRFSGKPAAEVALAEHETDPDTWRAPLEKALTELGATGDGDVLAAAQRVMELLDPAGAQAGIYVTDAHGAQNVQVGSHNRQVNLERGTYIENARRND